MAAARRTASVMIAQASNDDNIDKAMAENVWASTELVNKCFESAYGAHDDVYILFTTFDKSRSDQTIRGIARMGSKADRELPVGYWPVYTTSYGNAFSIEWIDKACSAKFALVRPVGEARMCVDGDTVDEAASRAVLKELAAGISVVDASPPSLRRFKDRYEPRVNTLRAYFSGIKKPARGRRVGGAHGTRIVVTKK